MAEDVGKVCTCTPHTEPHGEFMLDYEPSCQIHSYHVYNPRDNTWHITQHPHRLKRVEGEIEVCDTCVNLHGEAVAWDQTWHALHKDKARQVQHCWRPIEPGAEKLVPFCGDPVATFGLALNTKGEVDAVPVCPKCHRLAMAFARREEWEKATSPEAVNIFKVGWHIANRLGRPKTQFGLNRIREMLGR